MQSLFTGTLVGTMTKNPTLTKICSSCGFERPLTAFLQVAGPKGTLYGNICASCRSGKIEKKVQLTEAEEGTRSSSGLKIDEKTKKKTDQLKKEHKKEADEKYVKEREKTTEDTKLKTEKIDKKLKSEKTHRETFLQSLVNVHTAKSTAATQQKITTTYTNEQAASKEAKAGNDAAAQAEAKAKGFDAHGPQIPSQTGGLLKTQGVAFQAWLRTIGPSAAMARAFGIDKQMQKNSSEAKTENKNETAAEYAERNLPTSRKR